MYEALKQKIKDKKIHLTHQRLKVLEYLAENQCHPTAEQIHSDLKKEMPTLSKTTVYNTLHMFMEARVVRLITIEDNEMRYDIVDEDHGHFKCECCGKIIDFAINLDMIRGDELHEFRITDKNVYFKGICPDCLSNIKT